MARKRPDARSHSQPSPPSASLTVRQPLVDHSALPSSQVLQISAPDGRGSPFFISSNLSRRDGWPIWAPAVVSPSRRPYVAVHSLYGKLISVVMFVASLSRRPSLLTETEKETVFPAKEEDALTLPPTTSAVVV